MCTRRFRPPDLAALSDLELPHQDPLRYAIELLLWMAAIRNQQERPSWVASIAPDFFRAVDGVLSYFDDTSNLNGRKAAEQVRDALVAWQSHPDSPVHPLSQLGRLMRGDPGSYLEYRGPVFQTTVDRILDGIADRAVLAEWDLDNDDLAYLVLALAAQCFNAILHTCYWATQGSGTNLVVELERTFVRQGASEALRGQLANLMLSAQALSWGLRVEFIPESKVPTPDFIVRSDTSTLWVEATSVERNPDLTDDREVLRKAIATAWNAKYVKFSQSCSPGIITVDLSGLFVSREHSAGLLVRNVIQYDLPLPCGHRHTFGIHDSRNDMEFMAVESYNRDIIGVLASALYSKEAVDRGIKGVIVFYGQEVWVDIRQKTVSRPQRGLLVWRGDISDPGFREACCVSQPPIVISARGSTPPIFVHLV